MHGSASPPLAAVTGATGFLGRHVVRALDAAGYRVRILARRDPIHPLLRGITPEVISGDLHDDMALRRLVTGADAVVHAAGLIKARSRREFVAVNESGSALLARQVAQAAPGARLVFVSSLAARQPEISAYAASKRGAEEAIAREATQLNFAVLRLPAVYGPWDRETLLLFRMASLRLIPCPAAPNARIALIHARDAAAAIAAFAGAEAPRGVFEISDSRPAGYGWTEIMRGAAAALGRRGRIVPIPPGLVRGLGALAGMAARIRRRPAVLSKGKVDEMLHGDWSVSPRHLPPAQVWSPSISLAVGLAETANWYGDMGWIAARPRLAPTLLPPA